MKKYKVGMNAEFGKTITESDVNLFAGLSGDFNPVHINKSIAEKSSFGKRIAHGILACGVISTAIGMYLPGPGAIYLEQDSKFKKPVFLGDTITAKVRISEIINEEKNILRLETNVYNQNEELIIEGEAVVKASQIQVKSEKN